MQYTLQTLKERYDKGEPLKYIFFWGHSNNTAAAVGKFVFSQWFPSPFIVDGVTYQTAEHWMMAQKAILFDDNDIFQKILQAHKPAEVKELGRQIRGFDAHTWDKKKFDIVRAGNMHKFSQNKTLQEFLMNTGDGILVEASPTDAIWGIGLPQDAKNIDNPHTWRGENLLGFALMEARDEFNKAR
jgi:ribA/ribD-fused uncharacterized protein